MFIFSVFFVVFFHHSKTSSNLNNFDYYNSGEILHSSSPNSFLEQDKKIMTRLALDGIDNIYCTFFIFIVDQIQSLSRESLYI